MIDLAMMIQQCAPAVGQVTMSAIVQTESGGHPWAIGDNTAKLSRQPRTKDEAVSTAKDLIAAGHNIDMGLGQINSKNLSWLGLNVEQVFDPCTNLAAAATVLSGAYQRAVKQHGAGQQALLAALSAYNTGSLVNGFGNGYVQKVVNNSGVKVQFRIPNLAAGTLYKGKHGTYKVGNSKADKPTKPLEKTITPENSPLEAPGFIVASNP